MGITERSSTPDTLDAFRLDLYRAIEKAGYSFQRLEDATKAAGIGVGRTTLNEAVITSRRPPTRRTIAAIITVVDPDHLTEWLARWEAVTGETAATARDTVVSTAQQQPRTENGARRWGATSAAAVIGVLGGLGGGWLLWHPDAPPSAAAGSSTPPAHASTPDVRTGTNPDGTRCVNDAQVAATQQLPQLATLKLIYSASCHAYWAKVVRDDNRTDGTRMEIRVYNRDQPGVEQRASEANVSAAFTSILVRDNPADTICATATIYTDEQPLSFPHPAC